MATYDVLVIGGGPAGLGAALALCRQMVKTALFDSEEYRNSISKHMHMMNTWDHRDAKDYRAAARKEILERYDTTTFIDQRVSSVQKTSDGIFEATTASGDKYTGRKLILASGVKDICPDIPGYAACWGNAIFHCLFCHGYEERGGAKAGFLAVENCATPKFAFQAGGMAKRLADSVTIYTHGNQELADALGSEAAERGFAVDTRKISRFEKVGIEKGNLKVCFEDGSSEKLSFLAHTPRTQQSTPFAKQLGLELTPNGDLKVEPPFNTTNVPGVLAVGDSASMFKGVPLAVASGGITAAGAVHELVLGY